MEWWQAAILGVVEGITEFLPVSSTGHLIIAANLMGLDGAAGGDRAGVAHSVEVFEIVIQGGAILAVVGLYWPRIVSMVRGVFGRDARGLRLALNVALAYVPAVVVGLLARKWVHLLFTPGVVVGALMLGGVYMILVDRWRAGRFPDHHDRAHEHGLDRLTPAGAIVIGLMQCVAMCPGVSRSMMTITGGMFVGLRPRAAAEFSFILGVPTLASAALYSLYKDVAGLNLDAEGKAYPMMVDQLGWVAVVVGLVVSAASAAVAIRWLIRFLNRHGLGVFGWYRIVLGVCLIGLVLGGIVKFGGD